MKPWNKEELLKELDKLSIERTGNTIVTKFDNRIIKTSNVSDIYEVFDFVSYLKEKIDIIESNFPIHKYNLQIWGGKQLLQLISEEVIIGEDKFHKSFYIINSTDKSRRLSFDLGLKILRKIKNTPAQRAAPKYKNPPEKTGPIVLLFNNNFDIGVLIDEQTAAIIAKIIPILAPLFMGKV